jgi:hypothetical protein
VAIAFAITTAVGQVETSTSIRGLVTDPLGAAVPAAEIVITNTATNEQRSAQTDGSGFYAFPSVLPGTYNIAVTHPGFKRAHVENRIAQVSASAQVDVQLQVGDTAESITVSAQGMELLTTTSAEVAGTIVNKLVDNIPLNGRNFFDLAATMPHVSLLNLGPQMSFAGGQMNNVFGQNASSPYFRSTGIFAAGNRDSATNVSIDGVNIQLSALRENAIEEPPSAIEEIKVNVSSMNAEFGNGVAAVNVITKSGSNALHGDIYEYLHSSKLDSNYFFNNLNGASKTPFKQNQFGAAAGGPVIRNKVFFFAAYEGLRIRQSTFSTITVPPDDLRNADFSNYHPPGTGKGAFLPTPTIFDPSNYDPASGLRSPFPGNKIPLSRVDAIAYKFLQNYVAPPNTVVDGIPRYAGSSHQTLNSDQGLARIDWAKSETSRIYGRYSRMYTPSANSNVEPLASLNEKGSDQDGVIHWTKVISNATVNDVRGGYARPIWAKVRAAGLPDVSTAIGLANTSDLGGGPTFSGTGFSMDATQSTPLIDIDNTYQFADEFTHVVGRHSLKAGFQAIERRFYYIQQSNDKGSFTFATAFTAACPGGKASCTAAQTAAGISSGGNAFAEYLLGTPTTSLFQLDADPYRGYQRYYGIYLQDSWRVNTKLTLNYGLRYEYWSPWTVPRNTVIRFNERTGTLDYVLQNPLDYLDPASGYGKDAPLNPNLPRTGYTTSALNFAPRIGLAYGISSKTVFRAGWGIYYDGNYNMNQFQDISTAAGPFRLRYNPIVSTGDQEPSLHVSGNFPFPGPTAIPQQNSSPLSTFRTLKSYYPISSVQEWSASIQQRLGSEWAAEISYQGTHAIHLNQFEDINPPSLPQGPLANLTIDQRRKFPQWGIIGTWAPIGYGRYNGVAASVRNRTWHGFTFLSDFTFAKNIVSSILGQSDQGNQSAQVPYLWRGPARLTPKFRFVNSFSYDLPFGPGKLLKGPASRFGSAIVSGWVVSGIIDMTTGSPTYVTTNDISGTGYGQMPNRICDGRNVPGGRSRLEWFNTACFVNAPFGTWGNSNFGVYTDPGINNWNLAVAKNVKIGVPSETGMIEFRLDLFNAWNHTQWGAATNATLQSGNVNAGTITYTRPPRQLQMSLRYRF